MNFWKRLRWIASIAFALLLLIAWFGADVPQIRVCGGSGMPRCMPAIPTN
jgi:hypothetical protein